MIASAGHEWKLVAPWWRWERQFADEGRPPRRTRPVIQKYETADPVTTFAKDPQKSLAYDDKDWVHRVKSWSLPTIPAATKRSSFIDVELEKTDVRKLFLPTHKRFYLVVCELHCDRPGMPNTHRDQVCETGFVVRRRHVSYPAGSETEAKDLLKESNSLLAQLGALGRRESPKKKGFRKRHARSAGGGVIATMATAVSGVIFDQAQAATIEVDAAVAAKKAELTAKLATVRASLKKWSADNGVGWVYEGWVPSEFERVGSWEPVEDAPQKVAEDVYPLYPLIPDPDDTAHDAAGRNVYFGMIPAVSLETDTGGNARYDDVSRYVVRCFVRRHQQDKEKTGERGDCCGELVWSEPTEVYQLAAHFDPVGTGNQPITIKLPDIPALAATTAPLPVKMVSPPGSALNVKTDADGKPANGGVGEAICFFSIPLITIIAMFVLNLFLPIVVFLFNLWFLLGLKFCIPPSLNIEAGAQFQADLEGELKLALDVEVGVTIGGSVVVDLALQEEIVSSTLGANLNGTFIGDRKAAYDPSDMTWNVEVGTPGHTLSTNYDNDLLLDLNATVTADRTDEVAAASITADLKWEPRVTATASVEAG